MTTRSKMQWLVAFVSVIHVAVASKFTAATLQYPIKGSYRNSARTNLDLVLSDLHRYALDAAKEGADLIVFPEVILWNYGMVLGRNAMLDYCEHSIPDPAEIVSPINPCAEADRFPTVLHNLSCTAAAAGVVVVANTCDIQFCDANATTPLGVCPRDGRFQLNTETVFAADGRLIARYHKSHLAGETPAFDQPAKPHPVAVTTMLPRAAQKLTLGVVICYDIEFPQPVRSLLASGVRTIPYSTSWHNSFPLMNALMVQQAFSRAYGINLLAANDAVSYSRAGGGIFSAGVPLNISFLPDSGPMEALQLASVPLSPISAPKEMVRQRGSRAAEMLAVRAPATNCTIPAYPPFQCAPFTPVAGLSMTLHAVSSDGAVRCSATFLVAAAELPSAAQYALFAFSDKWTANGTPDPMPFQLCMLAQCLPSNGSSTAVQICQPSRRGSVVFASFSVDMQLTRPSHPSTQPVALPMLGIAGGLATSPSRLSFTESSAGDYAAVRSVGAFSPEEPLFSAGIMRMLT